jgi:hypothetical protein
MRKIFNFLVLLILIKKNNISIFRKNCKQSASDYYYYFDKSNKTTILFKKTIYVSYINYEVCLVKAKKNYPFNLWNWQAKLLYTIAKNKYLKNDNILF